MSDFRVLFYKDHAQRDLKLKDFKNFFFFM